VSNINPKWNGLLSKIPQEFHHQIIPDLQEWDKGVQERFNEIRGEYAELEKFKPLVDNNVDFDYVAQAVNLADALQRDAVGTIKEINQAWELGFVDKDEAAKLGQSAGDGTDNDNFLNDGSDDILNHPQVKAMQQALQELQNTYESDKTQKQREEEEAQALQEFEAQLDALEKKYTQPEDGSEPLPFNRLFVTALMAQDIDGDEAVKQYHQVLAGTVNTDTDTKTQTNTPGSSDQPPVVMGNGGTAGSGSADGSVNFGAMSTSDFNDTVEQLLEQSLKNNQG
jgi:hypothetical protein